MKSNRYVLITAAYNEEKNIEKTIQSVISQTRHPSRWIIVSDGSTDRTDRIIRSYAKKHAYITLLRVPEKNKHTFASKVFALRTGIEKLKGKSYDYMGILDADVSFDKKYFKELIARFENDPKLGIAGGNILEFTNGRYNKRIKTLNSVAGAVQLYRKECFADTIGFQPLEYGGEDAAAEISARMKGWTVKTYPELVVIHHGYVGGGKFFRTRYRRGIQFFLLGYHPLFNIVRCLFKIRERPLLAGSIVELTGFFYARIKFKKSPLPKNLVRYLRKEQMLRLRSFLKLSNLLRIKDQISY
jgi:biofilm PGA synthesis N-glycosyltransferase PgaC